jgi:hypothetical protein
MKWSARFTTNSELKLARSSMHGWTMAKSFVQHSLDPTVYWNAVGRNFKEERPGLSC